MSKYRSNIIHQLKQAATGAALLAASSAPALAKHAPADTCSPDGNSGKYYHQGIDKPNTWSVDRKTDTGVLVEHDESKKFVVRIQGVSTESPVVTTQDGAGPTKDVSNNVVGSYATMVLRSKIKGCSGPQ